MSYMHTDFVLSRYFHPVPCPLCLQILINQKKSENMKFDFSHGKEECQILVQVKPLRFNRDQNKWIHTASPLCISIQMTLKEIIFH